MIALGFLALAGCKPAVGTQEFVDAQWVEEVPESADVPRRVAEGYLALEFSSDANLNAEGMNTLYSQASVCPFYGDRRLPAIGPFSVSPEPVALPSRESNVQAPVRNYVVYLPVAGEIRGPLEDGKWPEIGGYDLNEGANDLCFVIEQVGYPWATQSDPVLVPAQRIARALEDRRGAE
tara:strand:+ start:94 stop:627 length:534 start_codon:yes stop_codon:yes gene_type:complete